MTRILVAVFFLLFSALSWAGKIAITFDDAPMGSSALLTGVERTDKIIKALKSNGVEDAVFFVTTRNIDEQGESRLKRYTQAGYHLANHSHEHLSANKMSLAEFSEDLQQAHAVLTRFDKVLPYYRFPYLHYGKDKKSISDIQKQLSQLGYSNGYVTVDNFDWYMNSFLVKAKEQGAEINLKAAEALYVDLIWAGVEFYDQLAQKTLGRSPNHVLLLHENDTSALFLTALIQHIKAKGWQIISPQEAYADPIAKHFPDVTFHKQGRVAALAKAAGIPEEQLRSEYETTSAIDKVFSEKAVFAKNVSN